MRELNKRIDTGIDTCYRVKCALGLWPNGIALHQDWKSSDLLLIPHIDSLMPTPESIRLSSRAETTFMFTSFTQFRVSRKLLPMRQGKIFHESTNR